MKENEKNKKQTVEVKLTPEERDKILEELVFKGETFYEASILGGKAEIKLKSLTAAEQIEIDKKASEIEGTDLEFWHNYALLILSYVLLKFGKDDLSARSCADRLEYIKAKPAMVVDKIVEVNGEFSKKIQAAIGGNGVEETFFENPSTSSE